MISKIRNIGISAHIDSGKTTLTERILFYAQRIHAIHDVKGKDGVGATMDFMELEKERGITIASASTNCKWRDHSVNIIDTPGHVDFTIEVERALRVLDGAILVLCSVGGVQSQSITVTRQMTRYKVPRVAFINKCDRTGANPYKVAQQLKEKLDLNPVLFQIPIGLEADFKGIIDLVRMKALYFDGAFGEHIVEQEIPADLKEEAEEKREEMLDKISMFSEEIMEKMLEGEEIPENLLIKVTRKETIDLKICPVFIGSAYKNKGVQPLLDAIVNLLPAPDEITNKALDLNNNESEVVLKPDNSLPTVALAFKIENGQYGQLTHIRVYQGKIIKGGELINSRTNKKIRVGRLIKMHANNMEEINEALAGEMVAIFGIDCASGDTFCNSSLRYSLTSMFVPKPVISMAISVPDNKSEQNMAKAINRFTKEDPTFNVYKDHETDTTVIQGMGELHLDVYLERMKREYNVEVTTGKPQVAYRETITKRYDFSYTHKKQSGGAGQFAKIAGYIEPSEEDFVFKHEIKGGVIPSEYIPSIEKGFKQSMEKGPYIGAPVVRFGVCINDGQYHSVDSSDMAFQVAAMSAFREIYLKAKPAILEPIMKISVEGPSEFQGAILTTLNQRRGIIISANDDGTFSRVDAEIPMAEMFGYSTVLRSSTQGKAEFTLEFLKYEKVPESIAENIKKEKLEKSDKK